MEKRRILYVVTEDWYFYSHRLPMARAAMRAGLDVVLVTAVKDHKEKIEAEGIRVIEFPMERRSLNPFRALLQICRLAGIYRREKPVLAHHIAMKPILYGSIAAWVTGVPVVVNAFAGLGYVFSARTRLATALRGGLIPCFRFLLKRRGSYTLFQNKDDYNVLERKKLLVPERSLIIRGSGVDLDEYKLAPYQKPSPDTICAFAGRMIGIKGLPTLKEAFALLQERNVPVKLWLCGLPDPENPGSWDEAQLREWEQENPHVVWKGQCSMDEVWGRVHLAVQASYGGEGVPKSLLEAAACGRAIIATDVPGCREVVEDGKNGYLVPPYDAEALARKIESLISDPEKCRDMGAYSRKIVESDLSAESVSNAVEWLYRRCLDDVSS